MIAGALAVGLTTSLLAAPMANAAEIGPKQKNNTCTVKLDDKEQKYLDATNKNLTLSKAFDANVKGYEAAYPELKGVADAQLNKSALKSALSKFEAGREDFTEAEEDAIDVALEKVLGYFEDEIAGLTYIYVRIADQYPKTANEIAEDVQFESIELKYPAVPASDKPQQKQNVGKNAAAGARIPASRQEKFANSFNASEAGKAMDALQNEYLPAEDAARKACLQGGNTTVAFPTKGYATNPLKGGGIDPETGKIIGIVAGVLAAVGLIAAAVIALAPQLGLALPFALPQLPF